jgi:hypothetical protein
VSTGKTGQPTPLLVRDLLTFFQSLPEMAGGWGGELMRREAEFMVLDGM